MTTAFLCRAMLALSLMATSSQAAALTLAEAVDAAMSLDPGAERADARGEEGQAISRQAGSLFASDPVISLQHYNDAPASDDGAREWEVGVDAPIWLPGQRAARRAVADAAQEQATAMEKTRRWRMAAVVRERLWDVKLARARSKYLERTLATAQLLETAVLKRVDAGELPRSELMLAKRERTAQDAALSVATSEQSRFETLWTFTTGFNDLPEDYLEQAVGGDSIDVNHPGLAEVQAQVRRAQAEVARVRSDRRASPVLGIGTRHERGAGDEPWNDAIALGISIPLGLPSQTGPGIAAAQVELADSGVARQGALRAMQEQLLVARGRLEADRTALARTREIEVLAEESLRVSQIAFELGEIDVFTLLQVRTQALAAQWEAVRMELDVGRDIARLNQALGVVP